MIAQRPTAEGLLERAKVIQSQSEGTLRLHGALMIAAEEALDELHDLQCQLYSEARKAGDMIPVGIPDDETLAKSRSHLTLVGQRLRAARQSPGARHG